jgi:2-haloacid dehalogenase
MKYKTIIFNADETLFDFKKSEKEAFKNTMVEFCI